MEPVYLVIEQGAGAVFVPNYFCEFRVSSTSAAHVEEDPDAYEEDETMQFECEEEDSDSEGKSIDYGDSESDTKTTTTLDDELEEEFIQGPSYLAFLEEISHLHDHTENDSPEQKNAQEISRLRALLTQCINSVPGEEVEAEEDYITSVKFSSGNKAIVVSSKLLDKGTVKYSKNPMHISTVEEILNSGNCRNPCDNNPMCAFTLVTVK